MNGDQGPGLDPSAAEVGQGRTWVLTLLLGAMMVFLSWRLVGESPLENFERPVETTVRVQERNLLADEDGTPSQGTLRWLRSMVAGSGEEGRREAIEAYRQALSFVAAHPQSEDSTRSPGPLLLRLAVTLLEAGRTEEAQPVLARLDQEEGDPRLAASVVRFAYGSGSPITDEARAALSSLLSRAAAPVPAWTSLHLEARLAERLGQPERAAAARSALTALGERYGGRVTALGVAYYALVLAGLACLIAGGLRRRHGEGGRLAFPELASGWPSPPWTFGDGWSVAVRSAGAALLVAVFAVVVLQGTLGIERVPLLTLVAGLPMLLMIERRLLGPAHLQLREAFGLRPRVSATVVAAAALALVAIEQGLVMLVSYLAHRAGHDVSWASSIEEELIFASPAALVSQLLDMVVAAPVLEEIGCRGLIYGTLRTRLPPWPAALISAALFAMVHLYSPVGFISLFVGAVASALVYERTRSLLPSIAAHGVNNLFAVLVEPLLFR
jgi:membrane protease YdiL (CAAX protease family)